jgi:hypothetical protein
MDVVAIRINHLMKFTEICNLCQNEGPQNHGPTDPVSQLGEGRLISRKIVLHGECIKTLHRMNQPPSPSEPPPLLYQLTNRDFSGNPLTNLTEGR